jgi:hypothetical protein
VATISLLHERSMRRSDTLNEQLQTALNSRVIIEQAKGKLAERLGIDMDQAFSLLRDHARRNLRLSDLARAFVDGTSPRCGAGGRPSPAPPSPCTAVSPSLIACRATPVLACRATPAQACRPAASSPAAARTAPRGGARTAPGGDCGARRYVR